MCRPSQFFDQLSLAFTDDCVGDRRPPRVMSRLAVTHMTHCNHFSLPLCASTAAAATGWHAPQREPQQRGGATEICTSPTTHCRLPHLATMPTDNEALPAARPPSRQNSARCKWESMPKIRAAKLRPLARRAAVPGNPLCRTRQ